ncbi:MAG TPA: hypothetical protein PLL18_12450, partial [Flavobacteriales bacterium]|nr:hypothetical protein [Flavobacteriales bacterium]
NAINIKIFNLLKLSPISRFCNAGASPCTRLCRKRFPPNHELRIPAPKLRRQNACPPNPPNSLNSSSSPFVKAFPMSSLLPGRWIHP